MDASLFDPARTPLLTADLPGVGGRIKAAAEDFEVEEIPAYQPSGSGDFLYLWVEKRDMSAEYFTRQVARRLEVPASEIGAAGLKDRQAVTRQMVSVPVRAEAMLPRLDGDGIRVLQVSKHTNKLRPGHLHGNRFRVLVRDASPAADVAPILARLLAHGLPNFYGPQRFGHDNGTYHSGMELLRGARPGRLNPFQKKLTLSAAQSGMFNFYLARRLEDQLLRRVLRGDVMCKLPAGGMFTAEDVEREQGRFDAREIVTAGPIFGKKTFVAREDAAGREADVLQAFGLAADAFAGFGKLVQGTRRHNLIYLDDLTVERLSEGLRLSFTLPAGSYATVLLREIMKADVSADEA